MPQTGYGFENARRPPKSDPTGLDPWLDHNAESSTDRLPPVLIIFEFVLAIGVAAVMLALGYLLGFAIFESVQIADWVRAAW